MDDMRTVILSGELGKKFGKYHKLAVNSPAEAIRALSTNFKDFKSELVSSKDRGVSYAVFSGKNNISKEELNCGSKCGDAIKIVPVIAGSKSGALQTIIGVSLIGLSIWNPMGLFSGSFAVFDGAYGLGVALTLGGVVQMLSPQQKASTKDSVDNGTSYNFNGPVNTSAAGVSVPLLYGRMIVGSAVISAGLFSEDKQ